MNKFIKNLAGLGIVAYLSSKAFKNLMVGLKAGSDFANGLREFGPALKDGVMTVLDHADELVSKNQDSEEADDEEDDPALEED